MTFLLVIFEWFFRGPRLPGVLRVSHKEVGKTNSIIYTFSGLFRSLFGHFLVIFFRHVFAKLLLLDSFRGRVKTNNVRSLIVFFFVAFVTAAVATAVKQTLS